MKKLEKQLKGFGIEDLKKDFHDAIKEIVELPVHELKINELAAELGLEPQEIVLPSGKVIKSIKWLPAHLEDVFAVQVEKQQELKAGVKDHIMIDGAGPAWLMSCIAHAWHPAKAKIKYPQGGPGACLPLSEVDIEKDGEGKDIQFDLKAEAGYSLVEFKLAKPQIDIVAEMQKLKAPKIELGKPVFISGKGPLAIAVSLAESYAHKVPFVALYQPGVGYVVSISHHPKYPIGEIIQL